MRFLHFTSFVVDVKQLAPNMMRHHLGERGHLLALLALIVIAAWPFLARSGLPMETDAELHVYRLAELARLIAGGELYPRWAPNFYFGYGYPIFNYYAPLAYYLGLPVALLPGADPVLATKFVFVLAFAAGAIGIYGFVGDWWGRGAALVAAGAYIFAPYLQYVDPHARGDLAEFLSFGLFPLALWAFSRLQQSGSAGAFLAAVFATALVILSHNLMALVFFALLCAWALWHVAIKIWRQGKRDVAGNATRGWLRAGGLWMLLALALGVAVASFFWLPVALEQDAVNLTSLIGDGGHFDFRNHFLSLQTLFGPTKWLDWGATEPEFTLNLGMLQWLLAALGVAGILTGFARFRLHGLFFAIAAVSFIFLMTRHSVGLWQSIPMMPYLQFPWRLLGPGAAMLAVLAGVGVQSLCDLLGRLPPGDEPKNGAGEAPGRRFRLNPGRQLKFWLPELLILAILLQAMPLTMAPPWSPAPWDTSARAVMAIERQGRWLGTTSTADFVPRTVEVLPGPQRTMLDAFLSAELLDRVNRATLPQGVRVEGEAITPLHTRYYVSAGDPFLLRLFLFAFPGWEARIDGAAVDTVLGRPEGFIVVPVPAGDHVVDVQFVETTVRRVSWLVSAAAIVLSSVLALWRRARRDQASDRRHIAGEALGRSPRAATNLTAGATVTVALVFLLLFTVVQSQSLLHFRSQAWTAIPAEHEVYVDLGGQIALIGYDTPPEVRRGDQLQVTLYWKAQRDLDINYQVFVHLLDASGLPVTQSDKLNPGDFPTRRWPTDKYVRDPHRLLVPDSIEPGRYVLSAGMWIQDEGSRLPVVDSTGRQVGDSVQITHIEVR